MGNHNQSQSSYCLWSLHFTLHLHYILIRTMYTPLKHLHFPLLTTLNQSSSWSIIRLDYLLTLNWLHYFPCPVFGTNHYTLSLWAHQMVPQHVGKSGMWRQEKYVCPCFFSGLHCFITIVSNQWMHRTKTGCRDRAGNRFPDCELNFHCHQPIKELRICE